MKQALLIIGQQNRKKEQFLEYRPVYRPTPRLLPQKHRWFMDLMNLYYHFDVVLSEETNTF